MHQHYDRQLHEHADVYIYIIIYITQLTSVPSLC